MNIWIFNHYAITPNLPGGTRHFDFGKELIKRGYKVAIFASSFHYSLLKETKEYNKKSFIVEEYEGVKFIWIKTFPYNRNNWKRVFNMLSYAIRAYFIGKHLKIEYPELIIGSSVHLFAVFVAYLLAKHYKVPFIMEVRDLWPQTLIDMGISKWHPFVIILSFLEKFLYKKAQKIIVLLPKAHEYIENLGISREKIVWISNGVDVDKFNTFKKFNSENQKKIFKVGYVGAIGKANNLEVVIEAADILKDSFPDIKFILVGDGPEKERLLNIVKERRLDNVEFLQTVSKDKVPIVFQIMDALFVCVKNLNLYRYGISFNKLFDYLASGKPIIFSSNSTNNPVEEAGAGITVPPDNPEELAKAIVYLYHMNEDERKKMGENGRNYVKKYYSIPVLVDKLENVIKEVVISYEKSKI